jgi:hypothetical protein
MLWRRTPGEWQGKASLMAEKVLIDVATGLEDASG